MPLDARPAGTMNIMRALPGNRAADRAAMRWAAEALTDRAAKDAPPDPGAGWTPELVGEQLRDAMRWVRRTAPAGPRGMTFVSLPFVADLDAHLSEGWGLPESADDDEEDDGRLVLPPSPALVTRHMAALQWPADYLIPAHQGSARVLGLWATCKAAKVPFDKAVKDRLTMSRGAAYALRDRALSLISQGLTRAGAAVDLT